ncbi:zinc finger protein 510-like [Diabrotica virgifera virgifera]|uniref:C2H2-type domain-containing protein n=1 Tax=Diabrotica virgifera virgifera TaxID=50390 RepID=A0ABM5KNF1_DIAVI|nr:zinc finger protein 510-like [Diabrotica virgifera virgifera]XP_050500007.1 zinc finger protein 510-like [Diabrotica virgifera virgifera]XP_050502975.1 zinc finger protein 510-like [Diabrotica virgifera virgifera]XP_050511721.1 zinc finger protein 510-like [Diabrotica virgifera virgifera]XP_050514124.1 zinc finger protein 510-like [Diabrotica virgifera virgifera]
MAQCSECKKNFSNDYNLRVHVKRKHADKLDILCPRKRKPSGSGVNECKECGINFTRLDNLRSHIKHKHSEAAIKSQKCSDKKVAEQEIGRWLRRAGECLKTFKEKESE